MSHIILIRGMPGSGKSTLAQRLARKNGTLHLEPDMICVSATQYIYTRARYEAAIRLCAGIVQECLKHDSDVIVSDVFPTVEYIYAIAGKEPKKNVLIVDMPFLEIDESLRRNMHNCRRIDLQNMFKLFQSGEYITAALRKDKWSVEYLNISSLELPGLLNFEVENVDK